MLDHELSFSQFKGDELSFFCNLLQNCYSLASYNPILAKEFFDNVAIDKIVEAVTLKKCEYWNPES